MKYSYLLFLLIGSVNACGLSPELGGQDRFVNQFIIEAVARGHVIQIVDLVITVRDDLVYYRDDSAVVGECGLGSPNRINLKRSYYSSLSELQKEQLVFHELGHCVLGLGHEQAVSIMTPGEWPENAYAKFRTEMLDRLFSHYPGTLSLREYHAH